MWLIRHILAFATLGLGYWMFALSSVKSQQFLSCSNRLIEQADPGKSLWLVKNKENVCRNSRLSSHKLRHIEMWFSMFQLLIQFGRTLWISSDSEIMQLSRRHFEYMWKHSITIEKWNFSPPFDFAAAAAFTFQFHIRSWLLKWKLKKKMFRKKNLHISSGFLKIHTEHYQLPKWIRCASHSFRLSQSSATVSRHCQKRFSINFQFLLPHRHRKGTVRALKLTLWRLKRTRTGTTDG